LLATPPLQHAAGNPSARQQTRLDPQTVLLAATAAAALIAAALVAVPSTSEATRACLALIVCF
jgi:hypothetical protein